MQISALEQQMKEAFKEGHFDALQEAATKVKALDPENHLSKKLLEKLAAAKKEKEAKDKQAKTAEYESMLKKLYKDGELVKTMSLAQELKEFNPQAKSADKWIEKAQKLQNKAVKAAPKLKGEKGSGFLSALFKKSEKKDEKKTASPLSGNIFAKAVSAPTPVAPVKPAAQAPVTVTPVAPAKPVMAAAPVAPATPAPAKAVAGAVTGNIFTTMFKKGEEGKQTEKSIIDTIVAKTDEKKKAKKPEQQKAAMVVMPKESSSSALLGFSKVFMNFSAIFIVFSAAFLYVEFLDEENTMLSLVGVQESTGSKLRAAADENQQNKRREAVLKNDIEKFKTGYQDPAMQIVDKIIEDRINWPDIFAKINEVTNAVYELNDFFKYIEYNNYSFDAANQTVRVSGTLSDPLGRNLTRLVELEQAFKYFPQDPNNPDDPAKPYFTGFRELTSFSKTLNKETGRYSSSFQLSFALNN